MYTYDVDMYIHVHVYTSCREFWYVHVCLCVIQRIHVKDRAVCITVEQLVLCTFGTDESLGESGCCIH